MRDMIAVLDGLGDFRSPSGSNGANYSGGGAYYSGAPVMYADRGLAAAGAALAQAGLPTGVFPETDEWAQAWVPEGTNVVDADQDYNSYLAAFRGTRTADVVRSPSGSNGANYSGGGAYYSGAPVMYADRGLAGDGGYGDRSFAGNGYRSSLQGDGYPSSLRGDGSSSGHRSFSGSGGYGTKDIGMHMASMDAPVTSLVPGGWATGQHSGGSSYYGGAPTYPSGDGGLVGVRARAALLSLLSGDGSTTEANAVRVARLVVQRGSFSGNPCQQAYQAAYQAARVAGYDDGWANAAGKRIFARCMALGFADFSTRA